MAKRRRDDDDDGFEVVDEEPPRKKKRPSEADKDTRSTRAAKTSVENDFEVVDDEPPRKKKRRPVEEEDEERPRSKRERKSYDEDEERPRKKPRRDEDYEDDEPRKKSRLTKKDRARMRREDEEAREAANANALIEWGGPIFMAFLGVVMMIVAGTIAANRTEGMINPAMLVGVSVVFTLVMIPIIIVCLMVIGGVCGIEYGTLKNAVRAIGAISMLGWGIFFVTHLYILGWFLGPLISGIITLALFMTFFKLDVNEAMTTLGALNIMMWLADKLFWLIIIPMLLRGGNRDRDFDPDDGPRIQNQGNFDGNGGNIGGGRRNRNPNPDDDDDF